MKFDNITNVNPPMQVYQTNYKETQAGAELGQAQLQLELGFTLIKVCCIILMITNYH